MNNLFLIAIAILLVVLNGFFVAAEFGLVRLRPTRIRAIAKTQGWQGRMLAKVHARLDAYLSACQLGITLASLGLGWVGEPAFAELIAPGLSRLGIDSPELLHSIAFLTAFSVISFLHIVAGELAPKSLAIRSPEKVGLICAAPLYGFYLLMYPAIRVLNVSANFTLRLIGIKHLEGHDPYYTAEELKLILRGNRRSDKFTQDEWNVLANTLDFSELQVSDLMRPLHEMAALHAKKSLNDNLRAVCHKHFSRYPYFDLNGIDVLGVIHLKDLFFAQQEGKAIDDLRQYLRPVQYVSAHTPALELFRNFRAGAAHFAIVGQKKRMPLGFITLDNLLSAMVGEIRDEFRPSVTEWTRLDDGTIIAKGSVAIFSLERILGIDIENEDLELENEVSVGGLILAKLRDIPVEGQQVEFRQFDVVIDKMQDSRILEIRIFPHVPESLEHPPA
ncbi:hemolysin family protein [Methylomicrobium sp. Wu6]|uniref:hemolysin family protein n=1 Tax=Methylomicrobium sp. Wu6 TaxID=3107928 RepID=UPI002DD6817C|nr:hemolysin family protein [Methylomicrobium sp. Wu6]MEC4750565.1 hemolysin family protein [Methylomicrobium sp. Wu6]